MECEVCGKYKVQRWGGGKFKCDYCDAMVLIATFLAIIVVAAATVISEFF